MPRRHTLVCVTDRRTARWGRYGGNPTCPVCRQLMTRRVDDVPARDDDAGWARPAAPGPPMTPRSFRERFILPALIQARGWGYGRDRHDTLFNKREP